MLTSSQTADRYSREQRYPNCLVPYLFDPVRIPEIDNLIGELPCIDRAAQFIEAPEVTQPSYIGILPKEIYHLILNELPFPDVHNVVASGVTKHELDSSWWWKRTLTDMPWVWELARVAPNTSAVDWAKVYVHLKAQDRSDALFPCADKEKCSMGPKGCYDHTNEYVQTVEESQNGTDVMVQLEVISKIRTKDLEALLAVRRGVDKSVKPGKGTEGEVQLQGDLPDIPGLANRRRIWQICETSLALDYRCWRDKDQ